MTAFAAESKPELLQLDNGARAVVAPCAGMVAVRVALAHRPALPGWAHLLEHLWFGHAARIGSAAFGERFEAAGGECHGLTTRGGIALEALVPPQYAPGVLHAFLQGLIDVGGSGDGIAKEWALLALEGAAGAAGESRALRGVLEGRAPDPLGPPAAAPPTPADFAVYARACVRAPQLCVAVTGAVSPDALRAACAPLAELAPVPRLDPPPPRLRAGGERIPGDGALGRVWWLMPAPGVAHAAYWSALAASHVLGGGLDSRLYRALRAETGWCYDFGSRLEACGGGTLWWVDVSAPVGLLSACAACMEHELRRLATAGPAPGELARAREHLHARLSLEDAHPASRARRLERELRGLDTVRPLSEHRAGIDAISAEAMRAVAADALERRYEVVQRPTEAAVAASAPGVRGYG